MDTLSSPGSDEGREHSAPIADLLQCGLEEACVRTRAALAEGEPADERLGELISAELAAGGNSVRLTYLLGIVDKLDCGHHILKVRSALLAHHDPVVRSKATLVLGRASRNVDWLLRRLLDPDARVQANAVESVWGIDTAEICRVFETAAKSPHNRVAVNALVGLYRQGNVASIARLLAAAEHGSEAFRLSARWAMGETGDPRFISYLNSVFRTDSPKCRAMAIRALARIRRSLSLYEQAGRLQVEVLSSIVEDAGARRIDLALPPGRTRTSASLGPTDFVITEDGWPVTQYSVNARGNPDILVTGFAVPRVLSQADPYAIAIESGLRTCLELKRKADLWCIDRYSCADWSEPDESTTMAAMHSEDPAVVHHLRRNRGFLTAAEIIDKVIPGPGHKDQASPDALMSSNKVIEILSRAAGERHLFLCFHPDAPLTVEAAEELDRRAREEKIAIHCIQPDGIEDDAIWAPMCRHSGGTFSRCSVEQIADRLSGVFGGLLNRYEITWRPPNAAGPGHSARLQIFNGSGCADCSVDLERPRCDWASTDLES
jgi:hypothetical protein